MHRQGVPFLMESQAALLLLSTHIFSVNTLTLSNLGPTSTASKRLTTHDEAVVVGDAKGGVSETSPWLKHMGSREPQRRSQWSFPIGPVGEQGPRSVAGTGQKLQPMPAACSHLPDHTRRSKPSMTTSNTQLQRPRARQHHSSTCRHKHVGRQEDQAQWVR